MRQQKKTHKKSKKNSDADGDKKAPNTGKKKALKPAASNNRKAILIYRGKNALIQANSEDHQQSGQSAGCAKRILSLISYLQYKQKQREDSRMRLLLQQLSLSN